jgi:regulator of RNase E activity RraA
MRVRHSAAKSRPVSVRVTLRPLRSNSVTPSWRSSDGACRDVGPARELGFPVFARAQVPVTARGRLRQKSAGEPIVVGDVTVRPGDVVMADEGGVVVVPRERATEVLDAARRLAERETAIEAEVRAGVPLPRAKRDARLAGTETT